jgi:hypothetical protein
MVQGLGISGARDTCTVRGDEEGREKESIGWKRDEGGGEMDAAERFCGAEFARPKGAD